MERLTKSLEKYLSVIRRLSAEGEKITPKKIGLITGHNAASVLDFIKSLNTKGFIEYKPYREIKLTEKGETYAGLIENKKQTVASFLNKFLLFEGEELEKQIERIEYHVDENLLLRMEYFLDFTGFCPASLPEWFEGIKTYIVSGEMTEKCSECIEKSVTEGSKPVCG